MSTNPLPRVAILDDYQGVALSSTDWSPLKGKVVVDVFRDTLLDEDALVQRLEPYDIVCAMRERTKFFRPVLDRLPKLKFIATTGLRNAGIDVAYAKTKGIVVSGTGGAGNATLEHIWALLLATVRYIVVEDANVKAGNPQWQSTMPMGLAGKTLGLVGVGRLGSQTAAIAKAFGMKVVGWSPHLTPERAEAAGVEFVSSKAQLFKESDVISIQLVLSASTTGIITRADLFSMKPTAFFINTSRGPLVDEKALVDVLNEERIAGAGLDVFDIEPLPLDHPLRRAKRVTLSPHSGYLSDTNYAAFWSQTVGNIVAFLEGNPTNVIHP
ncbi:D-isomer specific 2-hydroxyacid dehydrogenase [Pholiota conissans]|uniref:D-isomer specific 2-hydroxyacid dehydrogenase n=1 Tax=Pholiota conissans TaxID=109636 RepID=A0A9P5Z7R7_9AGAR|nr:D-isomer specific 2-hydroxyacid dehydrogenase [Pholiota conissans]